MQIDIATATKIAPAIWDKSLSSIFISDLNGNFYYANKVAYEERGYTREEFLSLSLLDLCASEYVPILNGYFKELQEKGNVTFESMHRRKDGTSFPVEINASLITIEGEEYILSVGKNITSRKQTEEELRLKAELLDNASDSIFLHEFDGKISYVNQTACRGLGYTRDELMGMRIQDIDNAELITTIHAKMRIKAENSPVTFETAHRRKNGTLIPVEVKGRVIESGGGKSILGVVRDIVERKKAEKELRESENKYRILTENSLTGIFVAQDEKFIYVNDKFAMMHGYEPEELLGKEHWILVPPDDEERVRNRVTERYEGKPVPLVIESQKLKKDGSIIWTQQILAAIEYQGKPAIMGNLVDITEVKKATDKRLTALKSTIEAIALTTEIRDPYTAGHQHRVAELACAIAKEMELPRDQIEGIRLIGIVHDIGKMYVPAEILSKPGELNELEFNMIKMHAKAGHDILKTIESPWPIAKAVLQHHLRLDGSGYPECETGKEIIIEARIVAVADVVEAMASHRPYRPALGIDKALDEITQNRGKLYDPDVVDACLKLFSRKDFKFE